MLYFRKVHDLGNKEPFFVTVILMQFFNFLAYPTFPSPSVNFRLSLQTFGYGAISGKKSLLRKNCNLSRSDNFDIRIFSALANFNYTGGIASRLRYVLIPPIPLLIKGKNRMKSLHCGEVQRGFCTETDD